MSWRNTIVRNSKIYSILTKNRRYFYLPAKVILSYDKNNNQQYTDSKNICSTSNFMHEAGILMYHLYLTIWSSHHPS